MNSNHFPDSKAYSGLHFFNESNSSLPVHSGTVAEIISLIEKNEACRFQLVEIVFVDKSKIKAVNREYLQRKYVTDVISFPYNSQNSDKELEGTLYCCAPRIREQAKEYDQPVEREFKRIIIHGLLHLVGYDDQSSPDKTKMRQREEFYLQGLA